MSAELSPGTVFADRFVIESTAGRGGMGVVLRARDLTNNSTIALKLLHSLDEKNQVRFRREAAVLAELKHPGIVSYIAHGEFDGRLYLAMEWLNGEDLSARLSRKGLTLSEAILVVSQVAEALAAAHLAGIIHRDMTPSNIILNEGDLSRVKLIDFGIARQVQRIEPRVTQVGLLIGTPGYIAPELIRCEDELDARADVFSLGCILFECLTGKPAFDGAHALAILSKVLLTDAPRLSSLRPDASPSLEAVLDQMLAKDRVDRPHDAGAVVRLLAALETQDTDIISPRRSKPQALTESEQRLLSVILAGESFSYTSRTLSNEDYYAFDEQIQAATNVYGGRVEKLIDGSRLVLLSGGGVIADQATRAARCALALHALAPEVPLVLATGRGVVSSARNFVGEVLDRGAKALSYALPGRVYVDEVTAGFLAGRFLLVPDRHGLYISKERDSSEAPGTLLGARTPFVGRQQELSTLLSLFEECAAKKESRVALIAAPPGMGKSRLRAEFLSLLSAHPHRVLFAAADPSRSGSPLSFLSQIVGRSFGIFEGEPIAVRQGKLRAKLLNQGLQRANFLQTLVFLGELIRAPFPERESDALRAARQDAMLMGDHVRAAFRTFLELERASNTVLVLEDLQWADKASLQLLEKVLLERQRSSFLVLGFTRPELLEESPLKKCQPQIINIEPLSEDDAEQLLLGVLGDKITPMLRKLTEQAHGNPFYLEELIRGLAKGEEQLPATILGMVEARLASLSSESRRILRAASVYGLHFWKGALVPLLGDELKEHSLRDILADLTDKELLVCYGPGRFPREIEYSFANQLLRDAAYAMLLETDKALGHRLAAEWLVKAGESDPGVLAEHLAKGKEDARAASYYRRAGEQAIEGNDFQRALEYATLGLSLCKDEELFGRLRLLRAEAHRWRGEHQMAKGQAFAAKQILHPGSGPWFRALAEWSVAAGRMGDFQVVSEAASEAYRANASEGSEVARLVCFCSTASLLLQAGKLAEAEPLLVSATEVVRRHEDDPAISVRLYSALALRAQITGDLGSALASFQAASKAHQITGNERTSLVIMVNLAVTYIALGGFADAEEQLSKALSGAARIGLSHIEAYACLNLSVSQLRQGQLEEALSTVALARNTGAARSDPRLEGSAHIVTAQIALSQDNPSLAEQEARAAMACLKVAPPLYAESLALLSEALLAQDLVEECLEPAQEAMKILESGVGVESGEWIIRLALYSALAANKDERATSVLSAAKERLLARADKISDKFWRDSFLYNVPVNERILSL